MKKGNLIIAIFICLAMPIAYGLCSDDIVAKADSVIEERVKFTSNLMLVDRPDVQFLAIYEYQENYYVMFYVSKEVSGEVKERYMAVILDKNNNFLDLRVSPSTRKSIIGEIHPIF